jgi:hypothetical protein
VKTCELDDKVLERQDASITTTLWALVAQCAGQTQVLLCLCESVKHVGLGIWSSVFKTPQSCSPIWYEILGEFGTKL